MAPYKILKQGYIEKEPPISKRGLRKKLVRYWFVLVEDKRQVALVYFKNEDNYIARQQNEGFIRVDEAEAISVIGEFMGRKHAFVIKTPKGTYTLVPQSRYDLHEWLFTLHNSLEVFKKKQQKLKQRQEMRQRSNTVDSTTGRPRQGSTSGASSQRTPPHTPSRRAPPPPTAARANASASRKRPSRPAPVPPQGAHRHSGDHSRLSQDTPPHPLVNETPPPRYMVTDMMMSQEGYDTLESGRHEIMDLELSHIDSDVQLSSSQEDQPRPLNGRPHPYQGDSPVHNRSASDSLILMHQTSSSMPDLLQNEEEETSTSPEEDSQDNTEQLGDSPAQARKISVASTGSTHSHTRHTRHLSLIGGLEGYKNGQRKKRVSRRQGSIKLRSRSPPDLPPPPPPGDVPASPLSSMPQGNTPDQTQLVAPSSLKRSEESTASIGFSGVMDTISNIEHELDVMSDEFSPKPTFPAPQRPSINEGATFNYSDVRSPSPVMENPEMEREEETTHDDNFNEEEWLCDAPLEPHPLDDHAPEQSIDRDLGPSPKVVEDQVRQNVLASPENAHIETISSVVQEKGPRRSKQVMFKEEVEDIPNTYEPCADNYSSEDEDKIPSSVAELKKRLFGTKEGEAARYKKDGVLSPKYTHPENVSFESGYHFYDDRERSPNVNNNNSGGESEQVPDDNHYGDGDEHNLYDEPWEKSTASKFKVLGVAKKSVQVQKDPTPPPVAPKPTTPPPKEKTPPRDTENGNVLSQSLDRYSYSKERSGSVGNESLLSSISHILQERSRYGSDSLLHNFEPGSPTKKKAEVKFSSRGELEKIRAAHRREPPAPPATQGTFPLAQGASPPAPKRNSPNHQRHNGLPAAFSKRSFGEFGGPPRMAASLDALRETKPDTQVTYDINTNSHTLRSLV